MAISNELVNLASSLVAVKEACNEALEAKGASAVNCLDEIANAISSIEGGGGFEEPQFYAVFNTRGEVTHLKLGDRTKPYATGNSVVGNFTDAFSLAYGAEVTLYLNVRGSYASAAVSNIQFLIDQYEIETAGLTIYGAYDYVSKVYYWGEIDVPASIEANEIVWVAGSRDDEKGVTPASEEA